MSKPEQAPESAAPRGRPLLRQATTVADPMGEDAAVTVHLLILGVEDPPENFPDLNEAGWIRHMCNDMSVYVRIVW
jgi:hypothetical protein